MKQKKLIIIGARGFGREICNIASTCLGYETEFVVKGFLDDKSNALDGLGGYPPILGRLEDYRFTSEEFFFVGLGEPKYKRKYAEIALRYGGTPCNLIHATAAIGMNTRIGCGVLLGAGARVSVDCEIGDYTAINSYVCIGHDAKVGRFCHIGALSFMGGYSVLGDEVTLHPRSFILPHKKVGNNAVVGAGSVCIRNVKPSITVFGIPAKEIK